MVPKDETKQKDLSTAYLYIYSQPKLGTCISSSLLAKNFEQINPLDSKIHSVQLITSGKSMTTR